MQSRKVSIASMFFAALALPAASALAAPLSQSVVNYTFDEQTVGDPVSTTSPGTSPTQVYSTGGFPDVGGTPTGTVTVQDVAGLSKAAQLTTTQGGIGSNFLDTQFLSGATNAAVVSFDIGVLQAPSTGSPQSATNAPGGQAFVVQAFANGGSRAFRFVATPNSATGGNFGLRDNSVGDLVPSSLVPYTNGQSYHVELNLDYTTQTLSESINNSQVVTNFPFVNAGITDLEELFIFENGIEGQTTSGAIDNIAVSVPEPASIGLFAVAGGSLLLRRRRAIA